MMDSRCLLLAAVAGLLFVTSSANEPDCQEYYQSNGPQITPCIKEVILQNGQNYTLKCRASTPVEFIHQEQAEEIIGNFNITQEIITNENSDEYEVNLELYNIDRYAIGYYACLRKDSMIDKDVINQLVAEPNNTESITYIYIYVNGTGSLFAPMREFVLGKNGLYVAECRPTTPDVEVHISIMSQNKTPKFLMFSPKIGFVMEQCSKVAYKCMGNKTGRNPERKTIRWQKDQEKPTLIGGYHEFLENETFSLNCSAKYASNAAVVLHWVYPNDSLTGFIEESNNNYDNLLTTGKVYRNITIKYATSAYAGNYTCVAKGGHCEERQTTFEKIFLDKDQLEVTEFYPSRKLVGRQKVLGLSVAVTSYPPMNYTFYKDGIEIESSPTYEISNNVRTNEIALKVHRKSVEDSGNYTLSITNGIRTKNFTYDMQFKVAPQLKFESSDKTCLLNTNTSLQCEVTGLPLPTVKWIVNNTEMESSSIEYDTKIYKERAILNIKCLESGPISCNATNTINTPEAPKPMSRNLVVYELPDGFGIYNQNDEKLIRFPANEAATVKCVASKFYFTNVTWTKNNGLSGSVEHTNNPYSLVAILKMNPTSSEHSEKYTCHGVYNNNTLISDEIEIKVDPLQEPTLDFTHDIVDGVQIFQPINMACTAQGVPQPEIKWYKDGVEFKSNDSNIILSNNTIVDYRTVNSSINIKKMSKENSGKYECVANNKEGAAQQSVMLKLKDKPIEPAYLKYSIAIAVIVIILLALVIYLICKVKKEKRFRKELAAAGLLYFKEGVTRSLNPELGIDEQAELLPYNEKFEFPADKLELGRQLGAGAFGVVYKAEARGIINAEESTTVAVKTVKKTADNMYIKALASELKIMVHLGKHINIVNLLGACTKNVGKRELVVIVEYCKFGNIHNYLQRHREVFIDQLSDTNKEKSFGKVNRGYDSTGSTGVQSDYGTANTQDTDLSNHTTNRTGRKNAPIQPTEVKVSEGGYLQPEWRCNYESDYSYEADGRAPRPLTSRDLLTWAFQIARGMEYLASRKVLHGDLAARNILLADDNIVKICDFGLAKSIYKNDEYQKKENSLLPVKWLAIECMTDRIFSTQSDVWSFGIVLWELFTLAKTPYPNMSPAHLLQFLRDGHRLEKPPYSDDRIYNLMKLCWSEKPTTRPSFSHLQDTLGTFLEDNVRNHYVELNKVYMEGNTQSEGQEDYLAMVSAPDYNVMVTPSPNHIYVNEKSTNFFPPSPTQTDEDGYLQMSPGNIQNIFSPKTTTTKFDFDPRKLESKASSGGTERTPMLTLNNIPRSSSDSDHDDNVSPVSSDCPRTDEVFDLQTLNQNAKNDQFTNATNPMYICFNNEKKPIENSYSNIIPNDLVK